MQHCELLSICDITLFMISMPIMCHASIEGQLRVICQQTEPRTKIKKTATKTSSHHLATVARSRANILTSACSTSMPPQRWSASGPVARRVRTVLVGWSSPQPGGPTWQTTAARASAERGGGPGRPADNCSCAVSGTVESSGRDREWEN